MLDPSQADVLDDALGVDGSDRWAATEVAVVEPRQNGKGTILEARALAGLFAFHEPLILWTAHEFKTAREGFLRIRSLVENAPHLDRQVKAYRTGAGDEGIELKDGCRLRFIARSGGSGRGFSGSCLFLDEAYALTDDQMAALMPTLSARPDTQIWYMSSAPLVSSTVLRRICLRGRTGGDGLAYSEWCADKGVALDDREAWKQANPALGLRISESAILRELGSMDEAGFRRERLGIWHEGEVEHVIDPEMWKSCADPSSILHGRVAFSVDTRPDRSLTSIGVVGRRADGLLHVELIEHRSGTDWVVDRLVELAEEWDPVALAVVPTAPAGAFLAALEDRGFATKPERGQWQLMLVNTTDAAQAAGAFADDVVNDRLRHLDDPIVNTALFGAAKRDLGGGAWLWSWKDSSVDISPLIAVTNARHAFAAFAPEPNYDLLESVL